MIAASADDPPVRADDGRRLWTVTAGNGPGLILIHGGPGLWDMFEPLVPALAAGHQVHRWDQRGCGRSDAGGPYSVGRSLADLDAVRRHFGHPRVALLGHSWGALLALLYALAHPDHVSRLVYVSGTGLSPDRWRPAFHAALAARLGPDAERLRELEASRGRGDQREAAILRWSVDFADTRRARVNAEAMATPWFDINHEANRALNDEVERTLDEGQLVRACRTLRVPTLILEGAEDLRPRWAVDSLASALPNVARVTLPGVGHVPWLDAPAPTEAALTSFLVR